MSFSHSYHSPQQQRLTDKRACPADHQDCIGQVFVPGWIFFFFFFGGGEVTGNSGGCLLGQAAILQLSRQIPDGAVISTQFCDFFLLMAFVH